MNQWNTSVLLKCISENYAKSNIFLMHWFTYISEEMDIYSQD